MGTSINTLTILLPSLYALLWADYALLFFRNDPFAQRTAPHLLRLTVGLHALLLVLRTIEYHHFPIATLFEAFSVLAFSVIVLYLLIELRIGVRTTGFFIIGIVCAFQLISSAVVEPPRGFSDLLREPIFMVHVSTALLGYSGMAISAVYGVLYLMLFYDIKKQRFGLIYKQLPSLEVMASFTHRSATLGLAFLTVADGLRAAALVEGLRSVLELGPEAHDHLHRLAHLRPGRGSESVLGLVRETDRFHLYRGLRRHSLLSRRRQPRLHRIPRLRLSTSWI